MSSHLPAMLCRPAVVPILGVLCVVGRLVIHGVLCVVCRPFEWPAWVVVHQVCVVCAGDPSSPISAIVACGPAICVVFVILSVFCRPVVICWPGEWPVFLSVCVLLRSVLLVGVMFVLFFKVPGLPGMLCVVRSGLLLCVMPCLSGCLSSFVVRPVLSCGFLVRFLCFF